MLAQNPTQIEKFTEFLEKNTPKNSTQTVSATTATDSKIYYVVISKEEQSAIANLYIQSTDGSTRKIGGDENIDKLILSSIPKPQAEDLIFQLAEKEVKKQGKEKLEKNMQNLIQMFGNNSLDYLSKQRLQAYQKLGITIPTTEK